MAKTYDLDFRKGTLIDSVSKTASSFVSTVGEFKQTEKGEALKFNQTNIYLSTGVMSDAIIGTTGYVEAWFRTGADVTNTQYINFLQRALGSSYQTIVIAGGKIRGYYANNAGGIDTGNIVSTTTVLPYTWYHVIFARSNSTNMSLYVNSVLESSAVNGGQAPAAFALYIGAENNGVIFFGGHIARVTVGNSTLTKQEIDKMYDEFLNASQIEKPSRNLEYPKPTDLSYEKNGTLTSVYDSRGFITDGWIARSGGSIDSEIQISGTGVYTTSGYFAQGEKYRILIESPNYANISSIYSTSSAGAWVEGSILSGFNDFTITRTSTGGNLGFVIVTTGVVTITKISIIRINGLIAAYNMIPNGNTLVDISGNGKDLAVTGMLRTKDGLKSKGNSSDSSLYSSAKILNLNTIWSVAFCFSDYVMGSSFDFLIGGSDTKNILLKTATGYVGFREDNSTYHNSTISSSTIVKNKNTIVVTSNGTIISFYINGVAAGTATPTSTSIYVDDIIQGYNATSLTPSVNLIDTRFYNRALTAQEVKDYNNKFTKPYLIEDLSNNPVNETMPKGFLKGTGAFAVKEYNIANVDLYSLITPLTSGWTTSSGRNLIATSPITQYSRAYFSTTKELGKRYRINYTVNSITGSFAMAWTSGFIKEISTTGKGSAETTCLNSTHALSIYPNSASNITINITIDSVVEIPPLPTIKQGTKYLECTSNGTISIQNKLAFGTWEFDYYKAGDANYSNLFFVADSSGIAAVNGYSIYVSATERLQFPSYTAGVMSNIAYTNTDYIRFNTWYRFRITRTLSGSFTALIKGGSFTPTAGYDGWTLISMTGGSGTNPFVSSTFSSSNYMLFDLATGDRIANLTILDGIKQ